MSQSSEILTTANGMRPAIQTGLKQRFVQAAGWMLFGHAFSQVLRLGSSLVLTRLLAPELYGVMSVGYIVMTGLTMFSDLGLSQGAIQSPRGEEPKFLNVSWVVQIARSVLIALTGLLVAAALKAAGDFGWLPVHSVYAAPMVPALVASVSLFAIVSGFESTKTWTARRRLSLGDITKLELMCQVATIGFQLVWAVIAPSVWTLAGGWIFGALVRTGLSHFWLKGQNNRFEWDTPTFREIFSFGKWVTLSSAFSFLLTGGDTLLLSGMLDTKLMGSYSLAVMLVGALQGIVIRLVGTTVLPALGEVHRERPERLRETLYRIRMPLDVVCLLAAGALMVLGEWVVHLLYDSRYAEAGWMLAAVSLTLVSIRLTVFDQCLVATGRVKQLSVLNALRLVTLYAAVPIGYYWHGAAGAVYAVAASSVINGLTMLVAQARVGLLDIRRELLALPLYGGGLVLGYLVLTVVQHFKAV